MAKTTEYILTLNCGSSSLKFSLFGANTLKRHLSGAINHIGQPESLFEIKGANDGLIYSSNDGVGSISAAAQIVIGWFKDNSAEYPVGAIGHRIVQGGPSHREPEIADNFLPETLSQFIYLAPNHLPDEIEALKLCKKAFPKTTQVVCFDTGFHKNMPDQAAYYPLPSEYREEGLVRYGYHGLSYEYVLNRLAKKDPGINDKKIIIAHLGNGASMTAIKNGKSIDTTMGISPMGGIMMGTRPGDLDPGVLLFLLTKMKLSAGDLENLLSKQSGLKAITGISDMESLLEKEHFEPLAKEAITMFCYQARKSIGSLAAALGGLDILVFTGGIGENSHTIRKRICNDLKFLGIHLGKKSNHRSSNTISSAAAKVHVMVIATDEEAIIARHTRKLIHITSSQKK